jgi:hypothetical protein
MAFRVADRDVAAMFSAESTNAALAIRPFCVDTRRGQRSKNAGLIRSMFSDVGDPHLIRTFRGEVTVYQVNGGSNSNQVTPCCSASRENMKLQLLRIRGHQFVINNQPRLNP